MNQPLMRIQFDTMNELITMKGRRKEKKEKRREKYLYVETNDLKR